MKKNILLLYFVLAFVFVSCSKNDIEDGVNQIETNITNDSSSDNDLAVTITPTITPTIARITPKIIKNINVEDNDFLNNLNKLCETPRRFDTDGEQRGLNFLIDQMTEYGYQTETQEFSVYHLGTGWIFPSTKQAYFEQNREDTKKFGKGKNVIATTANPEGKRTLYITAHYDTAEETNGIRDNGSGVVVAMEIARQLQGINMPIHIEFIFFSAEEAGLQGSAYFVSQLTKEEKDNALGCINIDVVGEKGDNEVALKTYEKQINILSILMDDFHEFHHKSDARSDHTSFYMGEIPAIYFADDKFITRDTTNNPLDEIDINKLKELTNMICNFLIKFNLSEYDAILQNGYKKEYTDLPDNEEVMGYSLIQANKVLKANGVGSKIQYFLKDRKENQILITEEDSLFIDENLLKEFENYDTYHEHIKYKVIDNKKACILYRDEWVGNNFGILEGDITVDKALKVIEGRDDMINGGTLLYGLE